MRPHHQPGPLQTVKLMLTALGILFLGVSVFAYAWGGQSPWSMQLPMAVDEEAASLLRSLRQEGMDCRPRPGQPDLFDCQYRQPEGRRHDGQAGLRAELAAG